MNGFRWLGTNWNYRVDYETRGGVNSVYTDSRSGALATAAGEFKRRGVLRVQVFEAGQDDPIKVLKKRVRK